MTDEEHQEGAGQAGSSDLVLAAAINRIQDELDRRERPRDFTADARSALLDKHADYIEDLGVEAVRAARRDGDDVVSAGHVMRAAGTVRAGKRARRGAILSAVGGIVAGAAASQTLAVLSETHPSTLAYALTTVALVIGVAVLIIGFTTER